MACRAPPKASIRSPPPPTPASHPHPHILLSGPSLYRVTGAAASGNWKVKAAEGGPAAPGHAAFHIHPLSGAAFVRARPSPRLAALLHLGLITPLSPSPRLGLGAHAMRRFHKVFSVGLKVLIGGGVMSGPLASFSLVLMFPPFAAHFHAALELLLFGSCADTPRSVDQ